MRAGAERVLLVPGDCPALDAAEAGALLERDARRAAEAPRRVVIVSDRHGSGTNALLLTPPGAIPPSFGPGSLARHAGMAAGAGADVRVAGLRSLAARRGHPGRPRGAARRARRPAGRRAAHPCAARGARPGRRVSGLRAEALPGLPEIGPGHDLAALLAEGAARLPEPGLDPTDVLVVAHKAVAKAEGRVVPLAGVAAARPRHDSSPRSTGRTRGSSS